MKANSNTRLHCCIAAKLTFACGALIGSPSAPAQSLLVNGGFEAAPNLLPGQTDVAIGQQKLIVLSSSHPLYYSFGIGGVPGWDYRVPNDGGTSSDHGIARKTEVGSDGPRALFINNWDRRVSQMAPIQIEPNRVYFLKASAFVQLNPPTQARGGKIQLVAGTTDPGNKDNLAPGATVLAQSIVGTSNFSGATTILTNSVKKTVYLTYYASAADPNIGKPLTVSLLTMWGSQGPMFFDDVSLQAFSLDPSQADLRYTVLDMFDNYVSYPVDISNSGRVADRNGDIKQINGSRWTAAGASELSAINDSGTVVGFYYTNGGTRAVKWDPPYNARIDLGLVGNVASTPIAAARGINSAGVIVGHSNGINSFIIPMIKSPGQAMVPLSLPAYSGPFPWYGEATDINDNGVSTGQYRDWYDDSPHSGAIWFGQARQEIPLRFPQAINNLAQVCGSEPILLGPERYAATWSNSNGLVPISMPAEAVHSEALDVNLDGTVVGYFRVSNGEEYAFLNTTDGGTQRIDDLLSPQSQGWKLQRGTAINDSGVIVGVGRYNSGSLRGFIAERSILPTLVTGRVILSDFVGSSSVHPVTVEVLRDGVPVALKTVTLESDGAYALILERIGALTLRVKADHWLARSAPVSLSGASVTDMDFNLINGDCDGDNEVAIGDYAILSGSYGYSVGDAGFDVRADLNGDETADIADYAVLSATYGMVGD
ncbi:MAG: hypothetical protein K1X67_10410 [Fimbriimonadaceae bacterium]|nr:hypothetical protein [Fimbriimonadaceae bacterium]